MLKAKICKGNIKTGKSIGTFSKLYGNKEVTCKKLNMTVAGSCGGHCAGCEKECYVKKSYRYDSVIYRHMINTIAFREDLNKAFDDLQKQLSRMRKKFEIVRIDQSGELESMAELHMWCDTAFKEPKTHFYIYTKAYEFTIPYLLNNELPENITVLISVWHDIGYQEYLQVAHLQQVKAFVYDDGYHYDFDIQTYCKAYDDNGKLDHEITCDRCRKCFNRSKNCKVIGCKAH